MPFVYENDTLTSFHFEIKIQTFKLIQHLCFMKRYVTLKIKHINMYEC